MKNVKKTTFRAVQQGLLWGLAVGVAGQIHAQGMSAGHANPAPWNFPRPAFQTVGKPYP